MIFNNNTTGLGSMDIPMAEGYDYQTGNAMALIESAKNDFSMFTALLELDCKEIMMDKQGFVNESELQAFQEAENEGLWAKIKEKFSSLLAKLKSVFNSFIAHLVGKFASDKTLISKYSTVVSNKDISNLEIKFASFENDPKELSCIEPMSLNEIAENYDESKEKMISSFLDEKANKKEFADYVTKKCIGEIKKAKASEFGINGADLVEYMSRATGYIKALKAQFKQVEGVLKSLINAAKTGKKDAEGEDAVKKATETYRAVQAYSDATHIRNSVVLSTYKTSYSIFKAAFVKAAAYNPKKKVEESAFFDVLEEVAASEEEVTDVLTKAINAENISNISLVKNGVGDGYSDDPNFLTYDKTNCYSDDGWDDDIDGTVKTCINSRCESYDFGSMLY